MASSIESRRLRLELLHPRLKGTHWKIKSDPSRSYNCIAFVFNVTDAVWQPDPPRNGDCWPKGILQDNTEAAWIACFEEYDFKRCEDCNFESGFEKIAIYIHEDGEPSHVAKLVSSGVWHSKMGQLDDIHHSLNTLKYGTPRIFMSRKTPARPKPNKKVQKRAQKNSYR